MSEEWRLVCIGFPLEDAISLCASMRREGTLNEFIKNEEAKYRLKLEQEAIKYELSSAL